MLRFTINAQQGSAGISALLFMLLLGILGSAFVAMSSTELLTAVNFRDGVAAQYLAEAGVQDALVKLKTNNNGIADNTKTTSVSLPTFTKNQNSPTEGSCKVTITGNGDQRTITSISTVNKAKRQLVVTVQVQLSGDLSDTIFEYAAFSGNLMTLTGSGAVVNGDVGTWHPHIENQNGGTINGDVYVKVRTDKKIKDFPSFKKKDYEDGQILENLQNRTYTLSGRYHAPNDLNMNGATFTTSPGDAAIIYAGSGTNLNGLINGNITIIANGDVNINSGNYSNLKIYANGIININSPLNNSLIMSTDSININSSSPNSTAVIYAQKDIIIGATITGSVAASHTLRINSGGVINYDKSIVQQLTGQAGSNFSIVSWNNK